MPTHTTTRSDRRGVALTVAAGVVLCVLLPSVLAWFSVAGGTSLTLLIVYWSSLFFVLVGALYLLRIVLRWALFRFIASAILATYFLALYLVLAFALYTGTQFDSRLLTDSLREAVPTVIDVIGPWAFGALLIGAAFLWICDTVVWMKMQRSVLEWDVALRTIVLLTALFTFLDAREVLPAKIQASFSAMDTVTRDPRKQVRTFFPDNSHYTTNASENVFMLQLESGNAMALQGLGGAVDEKYAGDFIPSLRRIARDGVFFPFFWSNGVQTNRAQEVMFCGLAGNIGSGYSDRLKDLDVTCLPQLLKQSGYTTIAFRADELSFANEGDFLHRIGFKEVHSSDIMRRDDPKYDWGYDDCTFYQRSFEYLREHYPNPQKLYVYFQVSSHHLPFVFHKRYDDIRTFPDHEWNFMQNYLNSASVQDHCAGVFYDEYNAYIGGNAHLFVHPDHSWPVGVVKTTPKAEGAKTEAFLIPLVYVPPVDDRPSYRVGEEVHTRLSEEFLLPTIFDLLNGEPTPNSFASLLRKDDAHPSPIEDCHLLVQPYSNRGTFIVVKNQVEYYVYNLIDNVVTLFDLTDDFFMRTSRVVAEHLSYDQFRSQYYCPRYQTQASSSDTAPVQSGAAE